MDIGSILNEAGGVGAVARELGVDESTVESGAGALLPHVVRGVETQGLPGVADPQAGDSQLAEPAQGGGLIGGPGGLGGMLGGLMGAGGGGGILGSLIGGGVGNQILGQIFGSKDTSRDVATQASQQSGVDPSILKKLLPIVAGAVAMHYMTHRGQKGSAPAGGGILGGLLGS
ncbi:MAG: DUF937 domain-containing protein [Sphingomicrobium sp.]